MTMPINYSTGDATAPDGEGPKIIVHVCNDKGGWGKGFVVAVSKRWPEPEAQYRRWSKEGGEAPFALGQVQFVEVEPEYDTSGRFIAAINTTALRGTHRDVFEFPSRLTHMVDAMSA